MNNARIYINYAIFVGQNLSKDLRIQPDTGRYQMIKHFILKVRYTPKGMHAFIRPDIFQGALHGNSILWRDPVISGQMCGWR